MAGIDESREFKPLKIAVLTVSDTRTEETDKSGKLLVDRAKEAGHEVVAKVILPDEEAHLEDQLRAWVADLGIDVILTTGGTGVTPRDITPEVVERVIDKHIPGFGELFRMLSYEDIATSTIQSRCTAGSAGATFIFSLPGSTGACRDGWEKILVHQLDSRYRPCNFSELLPRMRGEERG
jgi:molybdenum cofactor biosynthesis protein B